MLAASLCINMFMISLCPNCGHKLNKELLDGITQCNHCHRVVSTNLINELLSAAWEARKNNLSSENLQRHTKLEKDFSNFIHHFVCNLGYSHDEILFLLKKFQVFFCDLEK